ncbi:MAG TPA: hydroxymethylbilane synthase [Candidatus Limnocylindria bacterium]|jgi:hydroxymethylbilane synthase|nr:hydroxymethylbilane synthase [Candidatus Limnocylindria bacterium]
MTTAAATIRLGTRSSRLAMAQANEAASALRATGGDAVEIVNIRTRGDSLSERSPTGHLVVGDGQFTTELEHALLAHDIDVAVHSLKDLPTEPTPGLELAAILERADPRDCLLSWHPGGLAELPFGARVGTGSVRRAAQLAAARIDLVAAPIRGNVDTRLARLESGEFDAVVLAAAGLDRLGTPVRDDQRLSFDVMLPAPGQGAIVLQTRAGEADIVAAADHEPTRVAVTAERALLRQLGGGCLAPLGALAELDGAELRLRAAYEGDHGFARIELRHPADDAQGLAAAATSAIRKVTG